MCKLEMVVGMGLVLLGAGWAQSASPGSGHWEGAVQTPNGDMAMIVDLARKTQGPGSLPLLLKRPAAEAK